MPFKKPKPKGSRKIKPFSFSFALALLVLVSIAFKSCPKRTTSNPSAPAAAPSDEPVFQEAATEPEAYDSKAYEAELTRSRAQYAARALLGLKSMDLKESNGLLKVPFRFTPRKLRCQGGDLDTMKYASKDPGAKEILISLEPSDTGRGDFMRTSLSSLYGGVEHTFSLKPSSDAQSYGLYICSDSMNATSCKGKTLKSHAAMSEEFAKKSPSSKNDFIFYFQHVVLDKSGLEIYASEDWSEDFKKSIGSYLTKQKDLSASEFESAWKVSQVIRSTSADIRDGRLQLSLSYNDPDCMGPRR